jgi:hypothetical protein
VATEYVTHPELEALRSEMHAGFALLRAEMKEMRGELLVKIAEQTRTTVFACIGVTIAFGGIVFAPTQLA